MKPKIPHDLLRVLAQIDDVRVLADFAQDLLTPAEIETLTERWNIVKALAAGNTQRHVAESLGASITTVSRGSRQLRYGVGGFQKALDLAAKLEGDA